MSTPHEKGWWQKYGKLLSPETLDLISLEDDATAIEFFELILIPGLLRTEAYARALLSVGPFALTDEMLERLVDVRMRRQQILSKDCPPRICAVTDEAALRRQVGGRAIMRGQLEKILDISTLVNVSFRVLPFDRGAYQGNDRSLQNLERWRARRTVQSQQRDRRDLC